MSLNPGTRIASFEILAAIGAGGMGEVYRARDTKLGRDVAIKILPDAFVGDPERLARFEREARTLASLNHPNIAQIYGLEERALVMELVEGEDLAAAIARGPVPLDDALRIARQIATALEAAHELGIVHRDLKPANIKVRADGAVKVLDFGLAKEGSGSRSGSHELSPSSLTMASPARTGLGVILGTAAYMSPEQARGRIVDRRADVWAFGVVLYEMLSGRRAFSGSDVTDVLASILKDSIPLTTLPPDTPAPIRRLLRRCLEKDSADRLDSMAAARLEIAEALSPATDHSEVRPAPARASQRLARILVPFASAIAGAAVAVAALWRGEPVSGPPSSFTLMAPGGGALGVNINQPDLAISPDGRRIVYGHADSEANTLIVRSLDVFGDVALQGLGVLPRSPFFSPDGKWMGYFSASDSGIDARLLKLPIGAPAPTELTKVTGNLRGASWMADDTVVFATSVPATGLFRVPAGGGQPELLTTPDRAAGEFDHVWPSALPGGKQVLFTIVRRTGTVLASTFDIAALDLATRKWRVIRPGGSYPKFIPTGHLIYANETGLAGVRFDPDAVAVQGETVQLISDLVFKPTSGAADVSVADNGTLAYVSGSAQNSRTLMWVDRQGRVTRLPAGANRYLAHRLSTDNRRAAVIIDDTGAPALSVADLPRETVMRLSPAGMVAFSPVWSADGRDIFFAGVLDGVRGVYRIPAAGTGPPHLVMAAPDGTTIVPLCVVPHAPEILVMRSLPDGAQDILRLTLGATPALVPVLAGPRTSGAQISPDGRWIAYLSLAGAQTALFLSPYPDVKADRIQVASGGARGPRWTADSRTLLFQDGERNIWTVNVGSPGGVALGKPVRWPEVLEQVDAAFDVSLDGQRLLLIRQQSADEGKSELRVVLNWFETVKAAFAIRK